MYCDNKRSVCLPKQSLDKLCQNDEMCVDGAYCSAEGICRMKNIVSRGSACGKATGNICSSVDICIKDPVTGTGVCSADIVYRISLELSERLMRITVNDTDLLSSMNSGLYAVGLNHKGERIFNVYYNLQEESDNKKIDKLPNRMGRDFNKLYSRDAVLLILTIFQIPPEIIPNSVRDFISQLGSRNIRYISRKNYALVVDMKNRTTYYDQIADIIDYKHSITPYYHDKPRFLTSNLYPVNSSPEYGFGGTR